MLVRDSTRTFRGSTAAWCGFQPDFKQLAHKQVRARFMLKIYNTIAREKQEFVPITPGKVRMYVCGMTVYDFCHLGHARVMVVFDVVRRWLRARA
jgi:hypothetical protein